MLTQVFSSPIWQTIAAIFAMITAIALAVLFFLNPQRSTKEKRRISIIITIIAVFIVAVSGWGVGAFSPSPGPSPPAVSTHTPTPSPTATSISQVTSAITPTALAADGTITENKLLTCSSCSSDPIRVTIDSITIDTANGRTVWNVTLKNVGGSYYYVYNYQSQGITLQESAGTNQPVQATGYAVPQMAPGDKDTTQLIFAFVPHKGIQYTFSVHILTKTGIDMPFDPVNFTF